MNRVLVVDDKKYYRDILTDFFLNRGFDVRTAINADNARSRFMQDGLFSLVSSDCKMPDFKYEMSRKAGLELIEMIRLIEHDRYGEHFEIYTPIVMVTGSTINPQDIAYPNSRFLGVIEKRVNWRGEEEVVIPKLKELLEHSGLESAVYQHELTQQTF